jgi:hypothetical protein
VNPWLAFLTSLFLVGTATATLAQSPNDIMNRIQSAITQAATKSAWDKLPKDEFSCFDQKLRERGDSVQSLIRRGVIPSDAQISDIRSKCRVSLVQPPTAPPEAKPDQNHIDSKSDDWKASAEKAETELAQLKADNATTLDRLAKLVAEKADVEKANAAAEAARIEAEKAKADFDRAKVEGEQVAAANSARFEADKAALEGRLRATQLLAYGAILGLIVLSVVIALALLWPQKSARTN